MSRPDAWEGVVVGQRQPSLDVLEREVEEVVDVVEDAAAVYRFVHQRLSNHCRRPPEPFLEQLTRKGKKFVVDRETSQEQISIG